MRGNVFLVVVLLSVFVAEVQQANAQALDTANLNPDVVTIWHKLGIPQSFARTKQFRDSRVNRKGLRPQRERKPKLLRLADPANLEEGKPEMLKVAAKMKMDQDLAPQKLKALKYISSVGCSCYDKQTKGLVDAALVEGMKDCTLEVRMAAICVVIDNLGDQCSCEGQCGTCCSEGVMKTLKEIAYKTDDTGCYLEPNEQVRSLAERAFSLCPALPEKKKQEKPPVDPEEDITDKGSEAGENGANDLTDPGASDDDDEAKKKKSDEANGVDGDTTRLRSSSAVKSVSSRKSHGPAWTDRSLEELQIRGIVDAIQADRSNITIELVRSYELPVGSQLVIACDEENVSFGRIVSSRPGVALIEVDDVGVVQNLSISKRVRLGVLE